MFKTILYLSFVYLKCATQYVMLIFLSSIFSIIHKSLLNIYLGIRSYKFVHKVNHNLHLQLGMAISINMFKLLKPN